MIRASGLVPPDDAGMLARAGVRFAPPRPPEQSALAAGMAPGAATAGADVYVADAADRRLVWVVFWTRSLKETAEATLGRVAAYRAREKERARAPALAPAPPPLPNQPRPPPLALVLHPCDATAAVQLRAAELDVEVWPCASPLHIKETLEWAAAPRMKRAPQEQTDVNVDVVESLRRAASGPHKAAWRPDAALAQIPAHTMEALANADDATLRRLGGAPVAEFFRRVL